MQCDFLALRNMNVMTVKGCCVSCTERPRIHTCCCVPLVFFFCLFVCLFVFVCLFSCGVIVCFHCLCLCVLVAVVWPSKVALGKAEKLRCDAFLKQPKSESPNGWPLLFCSVCVCVCATLTLTHTQTPPNPDDRRGVSFEEYQREEAQRKKAANKFRGLGWLLEYAAWWHAAVLVFVFSDHTLAHHAQPNLHSKPSPTHTFIHSLTHSIP